MFIAYTLSEGKWRMWEFHVRPAAPIARIATLAVALAVLAGCGGPGAEAEPVTAAAPIVSVAAAAPFGGAGQVETSGLIAYKRETPLAFNVPGVIAALSVDEGQTVRAGQRLAALRQTQVAAGSAEAQAALDTAERELARAQTLYERGLVAQARLDSAQLAVERARAAAANAAFALDTSVLNAPAAGVILRRLAEPAQVVGAGTPVLVLGETGSGLIVRAGVTAGQAQRLARGASAQVRVSGEETPRRGQVALVASASNPATGAFDVEIQLEETEGLRSGAVATAAIEAPAPASASDALAVPLLALLDARADQGVVYVVGEDNVVRRRQIRTAGVVDDQVLVAEGLAPGERVVSRGAAFVRDGVEVTIADAQP
jgi:RND family efflux transporter MFP subunit